MKSSSISIQKGDLLISEPLIEDSIFCRSIICLLEHNDEGTFGVITNKKMPYKFNEVISGFPAIENNLYFGGPVDTQHLFYIHQIPELKDCTEIVPGYFWNGDLKELGEMIELDYVKASDIRFYLGYAGWSPGQLAEEFEEGSWLSTTTHHSIIFKDKEDDLLWKIAIEKLGEEFKDLAHYPINPNLN